MWKSVRLENNILYWAEEREQPRKDKNQFYRRDKSKELTKEEPLLFVLFQSQFTSVSTVSRGHPSLVSLASHCTAGDQNLYESFIYGEKNIKPCSVTSYLLRNHNLTNRECKIVIKCPGSCVSPFIPGYVADIIKSPAQVVCKHYQPLHQTKPSPWSFKENDYLNFVYIFMISAFNSSRFLSYIFPLRKVLTETYTKSVRIYDKDVFNLFEIRDHSRRKIRGK